MKSDPSGAEKFTTNSSGSSMATLGVLGLGGALPLTVIPEKVVFAEVPHLFDAHIVTSHTSFDARPENDVDRSEVVKVFAMSPAFRQRKSDSIAVAPAGIDDHVNLIDPGLFMSDVKLIALGAVPGTKSVAEETPCPEIPHSFRD